MHTFAAELRRYELDVPRFDAVVESGDVIGEVWLAVVSSVDLVVVKVIIGKEVVLLGTVKERVVDSAAVYEVAVVLSVTVEGSVVSLVAVFEVVVVEVAVTVAVE
ncbi:hypothetical protein AB6A40_008048 [Gnathostoma spinigerum]|uniref:Uncharacterized protein n=1 Tax=Gnathostoma spinigerum TaxID=75299 RepID=A0ABD6ET38_9BILA